ncbi:MAG: type II secretion system protein GspM [Bryobacteraceae bacterium]|nr:type II secretion system protein GspM [Bryobacteraceae bacterium]
MTLSERDRRALLILGLFVGGVLLYLLITGSPAAADNAMSPRQAIAMAEQRLEKMRQVAAQAPAQEAVYKQVAAQLAEREKRVLQADTAAQAQAQLLAAIRKVARGQNPQVDVRSSEFGQVRPLGEFYGEAPVSVTMECGVDQLLNVVSELTAQPELASVTELRVYSANQKQKTTNVRMTVSAVVPRRLVPDKKGSSF